MAKLFPFRPQRTHETAGPRLVNLEDDCASDVFAALSSDTARTILSRLYEGPATASDVAEAADTSLQNARYHMEKLESAGLIEVVDTWYSSRGTEMSVYGPTNEPLVVAAGDDESEGVLKRALERLVGVVALLAIASVFVDGILRRFGFSGLDTDRSLSGYGTTDVTPTVVTDGGTGLVGAPRSEGAMTETRQAAETAIPEGTATATPTPDPQLLDGSGDLLGSFPPGVVFFAGGLVVVFLFAMWWYLSQYRPLYGNPS